MDIIYGTNNSDTLEAVYPHYDYAIFGFGGNDWIRGWDGNDQLFGGDGYDTLLGGAGADFLDGGANPDWNGDMVSYVFSPAGVTVNLKTGKGSGGDAQGDTLKNIEDLLGSPHHDILTGNDGNNYLDGNSGSDTLFGGGGHDSLWGSLGNDALQGGKGNDHLDGGDGIDSADYSDSSVGVIVSLASGVGSLGTAAGDTFTDIENVAGSAHDDLLVGDGNANTLWGQVGNDTLKGGGGADQLNGSTGSDTASYEGSAEGVTVSLSADTAHSGDAQGDELNGIENVTGSGQSDYLTGDGGDNTLKGLADHDLLVGLSGADTLLGGSGYDDLYGGAGADTLDGGSGIDTAWYGSSPGGVTVNLIAGIGSGNDAEDDTLTGIENVTGSAYADNLQGNDDANTLVGGDGADTLKGGGGADHLFGGNGNDLLFGGDSADIFVWSSITAMGSTLDANSDTVGSDFNPLTGDLMALNLIDADGNGVNGDTAFSFIGTADNPFTAAGQVSWLIGGPNTYILLNTDGDAEADGVIRVLGAHAVDASWFVL